MEFRILGPFEVRTGGRPVALGGAKPRAVLAMLALHSEQPVSAERLAAAVWGEDVPPSAVKTVQAYVARLRKALGDPDVLVSTPAGYGQPEDEVEARLEATFFGDVRERRAHTDGAALSLDDAIDYALAG